MCTCPAACCLPSCAARSALAYTPLAKPHRVLTYRLLAKLRPVLRHTLFDKPRYEVLAGGGATGLLRS